MSARHLHLAEPGYDPATIGLEAGAAHDVAGTAPPSPAPRATRLVRRRRLWAVLLWPLCSAFVWGFMFGGLAVYASVRLGYAW